MIRGSFSERVPIAEDSIEKLYANLLISTSPARFKTDPLNFISLFLNRNFIPPFKIALESENKISKSHEILEQIQAIKVPNTTDETQACVYFDELSSKYDDIEAVINMRISNGAKPNLNSQLIPNRQSKSEKLVQPNVVLYESEIFGDEQKKESPEQQILKYMQDYGLAYDEAKSMLKYWNI